MREEKMSQNFVNLYVPVNDERTLLQFMAKVQKGWDFEIDEVDNTFHQFIKRRLGFEMHAS